MNNNNKKEIIKKEINNDKKKKKDRIPAVLRTAVWNNYEKFGRSSAPCYCCKKTISVFDFEYGHIVAESKGGKTNLENLLPVCSSCNKSMGSQHMLEFMEQYGFDKINYIDITNLKKEKYEKE